MPHTHGHTHTVYVSPRVSGTLGDGGRRALRQKPEEKREGEREYMKRCENCENDKGDEREDSLDLQEVWDIERCKRCTFYSEWSKKL